MSSQTTDNEGDAPQQYRVGDIVNGHRWTGQTWEPVTSPPPPPPGAVPHAAVTPAKRRGPGKFLRFGCLGILGLVLLVALVSALTGGDKKNSVATKPPGQSQPGQPKAEKQRHPIGQPASVGDAQVTVASVKDAGKEAGDGMLAEKAQGRFVAVDLTVNNTGKKALSFFENDVKLVDNQGRQMNVNSSATLYANKNGQAWVSEINPGNKIQRTLYFDVPDGAEPQSILFDPMWFNKGASFEVK